MGMWSGLLLDDIGSKGVVSLLRGRVLVQASPAGCIVFQHRAEICLRSRLETVSLRLPGLGLH